MFFSFNSIFSLLLLLPLTACGQKSSAPAAQPTPTATTSNIDMEEDPDDNHPVIKCNFTNAEAEPRLLAAIIDPEWSQVVTISREGKVLPPATGLKLQLEMKSTTPATYIWTMLKKDGKPYVHIQELAVDPPRFSILGRKPGTYECYRQQSKNIDYYKRF